MVVILMGAAGTGPAAVGRTLADALGWPLLEGNNPEALHAIAATALGRREHLVVATVPLTAHERQTVRRDLRTVRFVDLADLARPPDEIVAWIRGQFGI